MRSSTKVKESPSSNVTMCNDILCICWREKKTLLAAFSVCNPEVFVAISNHNTSLKNVKSNQLFLLQLATKMWVEFYPLQLNHSKTLLDVESSPC